MKKAFSSLSLSRFITLLFRSNWEIQNINGKARMLLSPDIVKENRATWGDYRKTLYSTTISLADIAINPNHCLERRTLNKEDLNLKRLVVS